MHNAILQCIRYTYHIRKDKPYCLYYVHLVKHCQLRTNIEIALQQRVFFQLANLRFFSHLCKYFFCNEKNVHMSTRFIDTRTEKTLQRKVLFQKFKRQYL